MNNLNWANAVEAWRIWGIVGASNYRFKKFKQEIKVVVNRRLGLSVGDYPTIFRKMTPEDVIETYKNITEILEE